MDFSNIPTGLKITSQIPLNVKEYCLNESTLSYLGVDDNLAYTYHEGITILCIEEKTIWQWREVLPGEENTGLIPLDFTYPTGLTNVYGINYSDKKYNFFLKEYVTVDTIQDLIQIENVGTGFEIYKGFNNLTNKHEIKTVIVDSQSSNGESFVRDIQENVDDVTIRIKKLVSDNLIITSTNEEVRIETPITASISALYVNDLYTPTYNEWLAENILQNGTPVVGFEFIGKGTLSQPFTDTRKFTLGSPLTAPIITINSSIQNALDTYVGTGTRLAPEKSGEQIIVQNNNSYYTFSGNFGYSNIKLKIESTIVSTTTGYILDADNPLHFNNIDAAIIELDTNGILQIQGLGLNNSGSTIATSNLVNTKTITLIGEGRIECLSNTNPLTRYIINSDVTETGNNNDGSLTFDIRCFVLAIFQGIYNVKGNSRIDIYGRLQSGVLGGIVDPELRAFNQEGGTVRKLNTSEIILSSGVRQNGITFSPNGTFVTTYRNNGGVYEGACITLFNKTTSDEVSFTVVSTESGINLTITNLFDSPNLWEVVFRNNVFGTGVIDFTKVDLTLGNNISSVNTIGNNIVESLTIHNDRAAAILAGRPLYSAYLKTSGVVYPSTSGWVRDIVLPA